MKNNYFLSAAPLVAVMLLFSGCDQNQKSTAANNRTEIKKLSKATVIEGTVSTGRQLIKTGNVDVTDENSRKLTQARVIDGHFKAEIPAGTALPLVLNFSSESHPEKLVSVVVNENVTKYFIDPSTTAIANAAKTMGGYTHANLVRAAEDTTHAPDANKTTAGWRGDPTSQYGGWH